MRAALVVLVLGACGGDRIAECDRLVAVADKIAACPRLDRVQQLQVEQTVSSLRDALGKLEDVGFDKAPAGSVDAMRQGCVKQHEALVQGYEKSAPECLR